MARKSERQIGARASPGAVSDSRGSRSGFVPLYVPSLFLLPALLLLVIFRYYPTLSAIYHSFTDWEIPQPGEFVGLQNYRTLVEDPVFSKSIANILKFMLGRTCLTLVMTFIGAELVYNLASARRRAFWRVLFTIPMVIPITVNLMIWQQVYAGRPGLLNEFLVGIDAMARAYPWLGRPNSALLALIFS